MTIFCPLQDLVHDAPPRLLDQLVRLTATDSNPPRIYGYDMIRMDMAQGCDIQIVVVSYDIDVY